MNKTVKVVFQRGKKGPVTFIDGRPAFPGREWKSLPVPGDGWQVQVCGENPRKTVYFLRPVARIEPRVIKPGEEALSICQYAGRTLSAGQCAVCGKATHRLAFMGDEEEAQHVCGACCASAPLIRPPQGAGYAVVQHTLRKNVRNSYGGGTFFGGKNLKEVMYVYGDRFCTEPLSYKKHGAQHLVYEVVRLPPAAR
jgi:hypothetical protein